MMMIIIHRGSVDVYGQHDSQETCYVFIEDDGKSGRKTFLGLMMNWAGGRREKSRLQEEECLFDGWMVGWIVQTIYSFCDHKINGG